MRLLTFLFLWLLMSLTSALSAQVTVAGVVTDNSGEAIIGASVYLSKDPGLGTATDLDGSFKLLLPAGRYSEADTLSIAYLGFLTASLPLMALTADTTIRITLAEQRHDLSTVVVRGTDPISEQFAVTKLTPLDIYYTPLASGDALLAISSLPAGTDTDESANPSLRGSGANRSRVYFNGVPVDRPVRNNELNGIGNFSLFNTELIEEMQVYASNPPLTYGNASAGLIEISTSEKLRGNELQLSAGLGGVGYLDSRKIGKSHLLQHYGNFQFSNGFKALNPAASRDIQSFGSVDFGLNTYWQLAPEWSLKVFGYGIRETFFATQRLFTTEALAESLALRHFNASELMFHRGRWRAWANFGTNHQRIDFAYGNLDTESRFNDAFLSLHGKYLWDGGLSIQTGLSLEDNHYRSGGQIPDFSFAFSPESPSSELELVSRNRTGEVYTYLTGDRDKAILWSVGLRGGYSRLRERPYVSGQGSVRWSPKEGHSLLLGMGQYNNFARPNYFLTRFSHLRARQISLDYRFERERFELRPAVYYKREGNVAFSDIRDAIGNIRTILGVELFLQYAISDRVRATLTNTYLDSHLVGEGFRYAASNDLNYFVKTSLSYNSPGGFNLSAAYVQRPGLRYNGVTAGVFREDANSFQPLYGTDFNQDRLGNYASLSMVANYYLPVKRNDGLIIYLTAANLLDRQNPRGEFWDQSYTQREFGFYQGRTLYGGVVWQLR